MTAPVPEERNDAEDLTEPPPGEHDSELVDSDDGDKTAAAVDQEENAESSVDQPSQ